MEPDALAPPPAPVCRGSALVSAHRGGAKSSHTRENSLEAFRHAATSGCDLIEFDVHRSWDGQFVVNHSPFLRTGWRRRRIADHTVEELRAAGADVLLVSHALAVLPHRVSAHVDVKFHPRSSTDPSLGQLADVVCQTLGAGRFLFTSPDAAVTRMLADWCDEHEVPNCVGLSLWLPVGGIDSHRNLSLRDRLPAHRFRRSGAGFLVVHHALARAGVLSWAGDNDIKVLVWTCDSRRQLRRLLTDARVWAVTSNDPAQAVALRSLLSDAPAP